MYRIIGADQQEYGPVSAEELRQWIRDGRADARTLARPEGGTSWQPLAAYPEFADLLAPGAPPLPGAQPVDPTAIPADAQERVLKVEIGSSISRAWNLVFANFWPVVGVSLLVLLAAGACNWLLQFIAGQPDYSALSGGSQPTPEEMGRILGVGFFSGIKTSFLTAPVQTLFMGGLYRYYFKIMRGEEAEVADAFSGFTVAPGQLLLLGLVRNFLMWLGLALCIVPGIYLAVAWVFAVPLVVDKRLGFWPALELSRKVITKNWFLILGLVIVNGLLAFVGALACCVGVFVTAPIASLSLLYAYEDTFGQRPAAP